jgi:hypothetical protein
MKKNIILFVFIFFVNLIFAQSGNFNINQKVINNYKLELLKIKEIDKKVIYINNITYNLYKKKIDQSNIKAIIQELISTIFNAKSEYLADDQIRKLNILEVPIPIKKKVLNIYYHNNSKPYLFRSLLIYDEEDRENDSVYYLGIKNFAFLDNNKYIIYNYSYGPGYNEEGIIDLINNYKFYYSYSNMISMGGTGHDYFVTLSGKKIINKTIKEQLKHKFSIYYYLIDGMNNWLDRTYWNLPTN